MIITDKQLNSGLGIPRSYGFAYRRAAQAESVFWPVPLHLVGRLVTWYRSWDRWANSSIDHQEGFERGQELGQRVGYQLGFEAGKRSIIDWMERELDERSRSRTDN